MIRQTLITAILAAVVLGTTPAALAQDAAQKSDKTVYRQLIRDIKRIDRDYTKVVDAAMGEARAGDGSNLELQAQMLNLRDRRDRLMDRLTLLALRHGWDVPEFTPGEASQPQATGKDSVFSASREVLQDRFEREAREIASELWLPVISLPSSE